MCITFLFTNSNDPNLKYKLILINNRDEFFSRKTLKARIFADNGLLQIFGTDVETKVHGTWLGVSKRDDTIRIGNLLNVPGEIVKGRKEDLKGRGPIAIDFIKSTEDIETHNKKLCNDCTDYNSFNFLSVEIRSSDIKTFFTNNTCGSYVGLETGFYGFSNSPVHTPLKKVIAGREKFSAVVEEHKDGDRESMIEALNKLLKSDERHYPDDELLKRRGHDAADFSSIHVRGNQFYGTRTRTVILIDKNDNIEYIEETMINQDPENAIWNKTRLQINNDGTHKTF